MSCRIISSPTSKGHSILSVSVKRFSHFFEVCHIYNNPGTVFADLLLYLLLLTLAGFARPCKAAAAGKYVISSCQSLVTLNLYIWLFANKRRIDNGLSFPIVRCCSGPPDGPFLDQISEICPRFKLSGLTKFIWPFGLFRPHLKLVGLKTNVWLLALFWPFYAEIGSFEGKY